MTMLSFLIQVQTWFLIDMTLKHQAKHHLLDLQEYRQPFKQIEARHLNKWFNCDNQRNSRRTSYHYREIQLTSRFQHYVAHLEQCWHLKGIHQHLGSFVKQKKKIGNKIKAKKEKLKKTTGNQFSEYLKVFENKDL